MAETTTHLLTGSQKVIGSIPIFSTENQRVASQIVALFFWPNNSRYNLLRTCQLRNCSKQSQSPHFLLIYIVYIQASYISILVFVN